MPYNNKRNAKKKEILEISHPLFQKWPIQTRFLLQLQFWVWLHICFSDNLTVTKMGDEEEIPADQIHIVAVAPGLIARSLFRELDIQLSKIQYQCT